MKLTHLDGLIEFVADAGFDAQDGWRLPEFAPTKARQCTQSSRGIRTAIAASYNGVGEALSLGSELTKA